MKKKLRAYIHASEILTGKGIRKKQGRHPLEEDLNRIKDGALVYSYQKFGTKEIPEKIEWVGKTSQLPLQYKKIKKINLKNKKAIFPGFIDCHTHLVFAGNRANEFAMRCSGVSYEEIASQGGGILSTIQPTREASFSELKNEAVKRVKDILKNGVRTIEIKSGYGLDVDSEIKILRVIQALKKIFPQITFFSTFLGAHAFPPEKSREEYIQEIFKMLLIIKKEKLADACDVFIDKGYFTYQEGEKILKKAKEHGLKLKIHADELFDTNATELAVKMNALSADHLLQISEENIQKISQSETVSVLLPGTAFYLKEKYAPARKLIDSGAIVAIATDFNPGSCMCSSLPVMMTLSALYMGMTRAEIFAAVTFNAAKALGLEKKKGTLEKGKDADIFVSPFLNFEEIYYRFASN